MANEPIFPADMEREIFETTALMHRNTIPTLLRVAQPVRIWIEPLLYRVIRMDEDPMADAVRRATHAESPSLLQDSVRHLGLCSSFPVEEAYAFLKLCPGIVSLFSHDQFVTPELLPIIQGMSQVRRWGGSLRKLFGAGKTIDLTLPFFHNVTHMDIFDLGADFDTQICRSAVGLATMPALTHLCLNDQMQEEVLPSVFSQCPNLQVVVNIWEYSDREHALEVAANPPVSDVRLVISIYEDYWDDWEVGAHGGSDFWVAADAFVARKRKGEIDAKCYWMDR
ncbi:hypothetical protein B0H17DRAFT_1037921 [Mycena rosella]|uniref:Uncharacterized protein n=1 Tax=Mycena rosella TaxID=1033263 RepID=A0AAD7GUF0_MYCRO|nr:hypothetical protein B0H17DRAFT_1037921 [Mycena rosella]